MKSKGKRPSISRIKPKGKKPPAPTSMEATVPTKLSNTQVDERRKRFQAKFGQKLALEKRRRSVTREINGELKDLNNELELLHEQIARGEEDVKQGDLFVDGETKESKVPPPAEAVKALAQVEAATSPAAQFVASLGERNGMDEHAMKRQLWDWCADKGIRGKDAREALWLGAKELVAKPADAAPAPESGPQATA